MGWPVSCFSTKALFGVSVRCEARNLSSNPAMSRSAQRRIYLGASTISRLSLERQTMSDPTPETARNGPIATNWGSLLEKRAVATNRRVSTRGSIQNSEIRIVEWGPPFPPPPVRYGAESLSQRGSAQGGRRNGCLVRTKTHSVGDGSRVCSNIDVVERHVPG